MLTGPMDSRVRGDDDKIQYGRCQAPCFRLRTVVCDEGRLALAGRPSVSITPQSSNDLLPGDQAIDNHDERDDEQSVDESAANMKGEEAKSPENEQDDCDGE